MHDLALRLKIPAKYGIATANGIMERLWHYAAKYAPQGDIGKAPDAFIAEACGWPAKDAAALIRALCESKWLDVCEKRRLIVHDWAEHADESVKKTLKNRGLPFFFPENSSPAVGKFQPALALALAIALPEPFSPPAPATPPEAPEPTATKSESEREKPKPIELDEQWTEFRGRYGEIARPGGASITDADWQLARSVWATLDPEQRQARLSAIPRWEAAREPCYWPNPAKFIRADYGREFQPRAPGQSAPSGISRKSRVMEAIERA